MRDVPADFDVVAAAKRVLIANGWHEVGDGLVMPDDEYLTAERKLAKAIADEALLRYRAEVTVVSTPTRQFGTAPKYERDAEMTDRKLDRAHARKLQADWHNDPGRTLR